MKKLFTILLLFSSLAFSQMIGVEDYEEFLKLGPSTYSFNLDQNLRKADSPEFTGLTLSGGTASTLAYLNASKAFTSLANGAGFLKNNGSGTLSYASAISPDGTVQLTADWANPAYSISALNLTATPTLSAEQLTNVAGWTAAGNWTYAAPTGWSHSTGSAVALTATEETAVVVGTKYEITMVLTTSVAGGGLAVSLGGQSFAAESATGAYTYNVTALSTAALAITPTSGTWVGALTVSVKILATNTGIVNAEGITLNSGQLLLHNGNATYPALGFANYTIGLYYSPSNNALALGGVGYEYYRFGTTQFQVRGSSIITAAGAQITYYAANEVQLGADAVSPAEQTIKGPDGLGNDKPSGGMIFADGVGTGAGVPIGPKLKSAYSLPAAATADTQQTLYTRKWEVGKVWAITDAAAAAPIITITCAAGTFVNGKIIYSLECIDHDGAEMQGEVGEVEFSALQHAAGSAYHIATPTEVSTQNLSTGALTTTWSMTSGTNNVALNLAADSDMDFTTAPATGHIWLRIQVILNSPQTITLN